MIPFLYKRDRNNKEDWEPRPEYCTIEMLYPKRVDLTRSTQLEGMRD